ncbi:MAG TPA: hypothetical protein VJV79_19425 [Polyangiaceae bacterium]|nr:hypothetical protein [Polyangiaceae bacterium]
MISAFGDRYLIDVKDLRAGEAWSEALERSIDQADVFQAAERLMGAPWSRGRIAGSSFGSIKFEHDAEPPIRARSGLGPWPHLFRLGRLRRAPLSAA